MSQDKSHAGPAHHALGGQRGQTSAEYLGVLVIVAAILAAIFASGIPGQLAGGIEAAICRIAGETCGQEQQPPTGEDPPPRQTGEDPPPALGEDPPPRTDDDDDRDPAPPDRPFGPAPIGGPAPFGGPFVFGGPLIPPGGPLFGGPQQPPPGDDQGDDDQGDDDQGDDDEGGLLDHVRDTVGDVGEKVGDTVGDVGEEVGDTVEDGGERVGDTVDDLGDKVGLGEADDAPDGGSDAGNAPPYPLEIDDRQFGAKVAKHAREFGLDPAKASDRTKLRQIIEDIGERPDRVVSGMFRGQGPGGITGPVSFRIKGSDVVVATPGGEFVTILKGGINNPSVRQALGR